MLVDDLNACLEAGASINVGLVHADGRPFVSRAFGFEVLVDEPLRAGLLLPESSLTALHRGPGSESYAMAATVSSIGLFRSIQLKGVVTETRHPTAEEVEVARVVGERLYVALRDLARLAVDAFTLAFPRDLLHCTLDVADAFEQTPGPGAGRAVAVEP